MKFTIDQLLPSGDTFIVKKEIKCQAWQYRDWKHGYWTYPFEIGDRIKYEGIGDNGLYSFTIIDPQSGLPGKIWYGLKKEDFVALLDDESLEYNAQYCYPS